MAEVHYCDICGEILLKEVYIFTITKVEIDNPDKNYEPMSINDVLSAIHKRKVDVKEICPSCKKVLEYFFNIRIRELKKLKKEIEKMYKQPTKDPRKKKKKKDGK